MDGNLKHHGVKGMKWGVRRYQPYPKGKNGKFLDLDPKTSKRKTREAIDSINSQDRTIKKGTEIQNITRGKYKDKGRHMYAAYTPYDKTAYADLMGNFQYDSRGYKNDFKVKKDIRIPSDKKLVETFEKMVRDNPEQVSKDMRRAYNSLHIFEKSAKHFDKKISKIDPENPKIGQKLTDEFISIMVSDKAAKSRGEFIGHLLKEGYDGMSDINDRRQLSGTQDPLIIFDVNKSLGELNSVKLTRKDLDNYSSMTTFNKEFDNKKKNLSDIQMSALKHHGVKGMKWGVRRYQPYPKGSKNAGKFLNIEKQTKVTKDSGIKDVTKAKLKSKGRELSLIAAQREISNLSTSKARQVVSRASLENRLKTLSNTKNVGTEQSKRDYLNRASMSNEELKRKVERLQISSNMQMQARNANKESIELGKKVISIAAPVAVQIITQNAIDTKWLDTKMNPTTDVNNWDSIGKQAADALDKLI